MVIRSCTLITECYQRFGCAREAEYFGRRGSQLNDIWLPLIGLRVGFPMMLIATQDLFQRHCWKEGWELLCSLEERIQEDQEGAGGQHLVPLHLVRGTNLMRQKRLEEAIRDLESVINFQPTRFLAEEAQMKTQRLSLENSTSLSGSTPSTSLSPCTRVLLWKGEAACQWGMYRSVGSGRLDACMAICTLSCRR